MHALFKHAQLPLPPTEISPICCSGPSHLGHQQRLNCQTQRAVFVFLLDPWETFVTISNCFIWVRTVSWKNTLVSHRNAEHSRFQIKLIPCPPNLFLGGVLPLSNTSLPSRWTHFSPSIHDVIISQWIAGWPEGCGCFVKQIFKGLYIFISGLKNTFSPNNYSCEVVMWPNIKSITGIWKEGVLLQSGDNRELRSPL